MLDSFVIDTHALIWFAADVPKKLGRRARAALAAHERGAAVLHVPAPVVLETWFLARAGRIRLNTSLSRWWEQIAGPTLILEPMTAEDVLTAARLDWSHPDVYDRLIVAAALRLGLPLITADSAIEESRLVETVW